MLEPLPAAILEGGDIVAQRRAVEEKVEKALQGTSGGRTIENEDGNRQFIDMAATAYARYRFGEMDGDALVTRYEQAGRVLDEHRRERLIEIAETHVDSAIGEVLPATTKAISRGAMR